MTDLPTECPPLGCATLYDTCYLRYSLSHIRADYCTTHQNLYTQQKYDIHNRSTVNKAYAPAQHMHLLALSLDIGVTYNHSQRIGMSD